MNKQQQIEKMKNKQIQNNVFDILDKFEFFQGQKAGRELWNDKPKEVQDKDIADFIKDINYIRSYLHDNVVLSREEYEKLKRIGAEKDRLYEIKLDLENQLIEKGWTDYEGADEIEKRVSKETAEKFAKLIEFHSISKRDESGYETFTISNLCMREILREQFGFTNEELETMWEIKE